MSVLEDLRKQLHKRKRNRERKRRLKQGHKARREARAVRKLRHRIKDLLRRAAAPRKMYDATSVGNIPPRARAVAGYVNGLYRTMPDLRRLFPKARKVSIAVSSDADADFLDVESGDATNGDAPGWFRRSGSNRGFYTSASNAAALVATLAAAGIGRGEYTLWTAHYGNKHICGPSTCGYLRQSADGTQWTTHGETVDESKLKPSFWKHA